MYIPHIRDRHFSQDQIEELKTEIKKTEYEKAREPLEKEINEMKNQIWFLEERERAYNQVINEIVSSLNDDYITLYVNTKPIEVQFGNIEDIKLTNSEIQKVVVPIKEQFRYAIYKKLEEINRGNDE